MEEELKRRNPEWDPETGEAKYPFNIHHSELVRNAKPQGVFVQDNHQEFKTNLAGEYGMNIALEILKNR